MAKSMQLITLVADYYLPSRVLVSEPWAKNIFAVVCRFSRGLGRAATLKDLNTQQILNYLAAYSRRYGAASTNNQRQILLALWRHAYIMQLTKQAPQPGLIRRLPVAFNPPEAWAVDQIGSLISEAANQPGMVGDVPASLFWPALFSTEYWTGCRVGALMAVRSADYLRGQGLTARKQKNGRPQWYTLPQSCCDLLDATNPRQRTLLFDWPYCRRNLFTAARRIIEAAGLPAPKTGRQLFHRLRRTTLSLCAAVDPAIAQRQAGHSSYQTTLKHYIDPRIARGLSAADVLPDPTANINAEPPALRVIHFDRNQEK